jgi:hypothetical protein
MICSPLIADARTEMKNMFFVGAALLLGFCAGSAHAADITGKWTADMQMPGGGDSMQIVFTFNQDGATFTGTVLSPQGDPTPISDGKIDGDKISFKVSFNGMTIDHEGTINEAGDEIKLSTKSDSGDFPAMEMTLKRVKPEAVPATITVPVVRTQMQLAL